METPDVWPKRSFVTWVRPVGTVSNRSGIGARVTVRAGDRTWTQQLTPQSYCSTNSPILHFGLGPRDVVDEVIVRFPGGRTDTLRALAPDRIVTVTEPRSVPVRLLAFQAADEAEGVRLRWRTTDDAEAIGFRVARRFGATERNPVEAWSAATAGASTRTGSSHRPM